MIDDYPSNIGVFSRIADRWRPLGNFDQPTTRVKDGILAAMGYSEDGRVHYIDSSKEKSRLGIVYGILLVYFPRADVFGNDGPFVTHNGKRDGSPSGGLGGKMVK
ncbi:MAG: hypothetical protein KKB31_05795 [Nanoarchaeota archaeon]|nr:hypothetical protein [Nanoarchaeota archaeon]